MANKFRVNYIVLSGQSLTADSNHPYLNNTTILTQNDSGNLLSISQTGQFANINNLLLTGQQSYNTTIGGDTNLSGNLTATGQTLYNDVINASGFFAQRPELYFPFNVASLAWAVPGAVTLFNSNNAQITYLSLNSFTGVQLLINKLATSSTVTGALWLGYSTTYTQTAANYKSLTSNNTKSYINVANTFVNSGWNPIDINARSGVYVALLGSGGNAVSVTFGHVMMGLM